MSGLTESDISKILISMCSELIEIIGKDSRYNYGKNSMYNSYRERLSKLVILNEHAKYDTNGI